MHEAFILDQDDDFLETYEPELENLRAAFAWAAENAFDMAVGIAAAGVLLTEELGLAAEGHELVAKAAPLISPTTSPLAVARLWCNQVTFARSQSLDVVLATVHRGIDLMRGLQHPRELAFAMSCYACYCGPKQAETAAALLTEARSLERDGWHPNLAFMRRLGEYALACVRSHQDIDLRRQLLDECMPFVLPGRSRRTWLLAHFNRAFDERDARRWSQAEATARQVVAVAAGPRDKRPRFTALLVLIQVMVCCERLGEARRLAGDALALSIQLARFYSFADPLAFLLARAGEVQTALRFLGYAVEQCQRLGAKRDFSDEEAVLSLAHAAMSKVEVTAVLARGAAMSTAEAVSLATRHCDVQPVDHARGDRRALMHQAGASTRPAAQSMIRL
jgi:hypothetical protein